MAEKPSKDSEKVTVEDLLQLKKHEQPDKAFWDRFERELHEKTLRSLVKSPSASKGALIRLFGKLHPALPLSGAAAFTLTFLIANGYLNTTAFIEQEVSPQVVVASAPEIANETSTTAELKPMADYQASYVVSALPAHTGESMEPYTQVAASKALTPVHRPGVQYVSGSFATSIGTSGTIGIY
ncbi:hypothetical protein [Rubellicoccus peritrichatus]|uniref:Uncharacterized protein n=1 Tax=Rubellicoccus peritrichatus TaxID=3080537 RepID=A0AAQ3QVR1_9BACT|nr:hypothetical protein [Puniceicoccus sp. CR14]WOO41102.1 hypothetical protein RZN69_20980 [Puniceicoccus sp. CR14]